AVAVNGVLTPGADGAEPTYAPRSEEEMEQIRQLVRSAMGYDQQRGDQVEVVNIRFQQPAAAAGGESATASMFNFDKNDIMRGVELAILLVVGLLLVFFVLRPLLKAAGGAGGAAAGGPVAVLAAGGE